MGPGSSRNGSGIAAEATPTAGDDVAGASPNRGPERDSAVWREIFMVLGAITAATLVLSIAGRFIPFVRANASVGVAIVFIYFSSWIVRRKGLDPETYLPLRPGRMLTSLAVVAGVCLITYPPFAAGFAYIHGWAAGQPMELRLPASFGSLVLTHLVVVAFPEEFLFRGYLQRRLDDVLEPRWEILGARVGWSIPLAAALFAILHVVADPYPEHAVGRLAVFFPALLFGWIRSRTDSVYAPALFHGLCNIFAAVLEAGYYGG